MKTHNIKNMIYKKIKIKTWDEVKTQREAILYHLNNFDCCTSYEVWQKYKITRLASIICNLRKEGYNIETMDVKFKNIFGGSGTFAKYIYHEPIPTFKQSKLF